jgi:tetratricopeptide (TPR) repeat protein
MDPIYKTYADAWEKLAKCIVRHEKERTDGVLTLLARSFEDSVQACMLSGDIAQAFAQYDHAIAAYEQAVQCYLDRKDMHKAVAVYEQIHALRNSDISRAELERLKTLATED